MSVSSWYAHYRSSRNNNQSAAPSPAAGTPANATVIDMNTTLQKDKKNPDSLFGPNIGVVSSGPAWTNIQEKKVLTDELTQDIVRGWIEKSKQPNEPTTTLQALVNLKRPTIRLSPLEDESADSSHQHHGLEFEYDCDAPKCGIYVHVVLSSDHPDAPATSSSNGYSKLLVFESVTEGGFGKILKLEEGAMLELARFEDDMPQPSPSSSPELPQPAATTETTATPDSVPQSTPSSVPEPARQNRRRFTHLAFRKRSHNHSVSGPALAVVDADPAANSNDKESKKEEGGVRVIIRLAALDAYGTELASPNEQLTYLHVVRFGAKPAPLNEEPVEDTRPWVVKVVKREATIGPHTFHLHEIYGLSASSSAAHAPTAPLPDPHSYPPESGALQPVTVEEEPSSECLLCLSSPREVVLLPCRHLVACKECALNMVEFGAGGTINQSDEPAAANPPAEEVAATPAAAEGAENPADAPASGDAAAPVADTPAPVPSVPTTAPRRKRKAKGWFCPVCRQPYTSLLRITTVPPDVTKETEGEEEQPAASGGGILANAFRPAFLRGFSRNQPNDIEAQRPVATAA